MRGVLIIIVCTIGLIACGNGRPSAVSPAAGMTDTCVLNDGTTVVDDIQKWARHLDLANALTKYSVEGARDERVAELQRLRREARSLPYPACGQPILSLLVDVMDAYINAYRSAALHEPAAAVANIFAYADAKRADLTRMADVLRVSTVGHANDDTLSQEPPTAGGLGRGIAP